MQNQLHIHKKLYNPFSAPAFEKEAYPICDSLRADPKVSISSSLLQIAHLCLDIDLCFDEHKVAQELQPLLSSEWSGFDNDPLRKRDAGVSSYWQGKFIRNFDVRSDYGFGDSRDYLKIQKREELLEDGHCKRSHLLKTDLWEKVPYIRSLAEKIVTFDRADRILLTRNIPKSRVNWHSHIKESQYYTFFYVHVPLMTEPEIEMLVLKDGNIEAENYKTNTAWILNTQLNHAVTNATSNKERVHLLIIARPDDPKFLKIVKKSLDKYGQYTKRCFPIHDFLT